MGKKFINSILFFIISCSVFAANLSRDTYYVKVDGKGDGSSWENAMSAADFAIALSTRSTLKSGVTFHLAAGTYHPMYDPFPDSHINYSDKEKECFKAYYVQTPINIIGGYSENPTDGEKPNPSIYETIISGDMLGDDIGDSYESRSEDLYNLFIIDIGEDNQCSFYGLTLSNTQAIKAASDGAFRLMGDDIKGRTIKLDRCTMSYISKSFSGSIECNAIISNCTFENTMPQLSFVDLQLNSCTFFPTNTSNIYTASFSVSNLVTAQNNTFYNTPVMINVKNNAVFYNNTVIDRQDDEYNVTVSIFSSYAPGPNMKVSLIGNIFDCKVTNFANEECVFDSRYNLYREVNDGMSEKISYDYDYITTSLEEILDKDWNDIPRLSRNGGYTQTVKIISDKLSKSDNYRSIHFDRNVTNLSVDQRGVNRFDNTCIGAYEKRDTVYAGKITIKENDTFNGKKYEKYGIYDSVAVVMKNSVDLDSVVIYKLFVIPVDKRTTFYVKTDGTGDGSSWEKALSPTDFAWRMCLSESIDTFYVAEGTYYPLQMEYSRLYERTMPICLKGGYPKNSISLSQESDPVKYKTILSVDYNNDNKFDYTNNNFLNVQDDGYVIFSYVPKKSGKSYIYGIVFDGGKSSRDGMNTQVSIDRNHLEDESEFTFEQCEFRHAYNRSIRYWDGGTLTINNCYFNQVGAPLYYGTILINACTFVDKDCYFNAMEDRTITITNCTMYNCKHVEFTKNIEPSSMIMFKNNTIYSNKNTTILSCDLQRNLYLIGNIIACNFNNEDLESVNSSYNVYLKPTNMVEEKIRTDLYTDDIPFFLDNQLSKVDNIITPVLVMTSDTLPDGTSLRFPLSKTNLTEDQRKWSRYRMTSVGSYEAECQKDSSYLTVTDTIYAGDVYMGKTFVKEGLNYGIDTLYNVMGCDSLIFHPVFVLPENAIPTAFTPFDSNDKNDVFMQGHEVYIYDIYGSLICHSTNGWNGKLNDENANAGIYVYAVKLYSGEIKKGTVELLLPQ